MRLWKRLLFSLISLVWGYVSLDYLYRAYLYMTGGDTTTQTYAIAEDGVRQLLGIGMFLLWFFVMAMYALLIQKSSLQIDFLEQKKGEKEPRIRRRWFDLLFQGALVLTGLLLRWGYLVFWLFPRR